MTPLPALGFEQPYPNCPSDVDTFSYNLQTVPSAAELEEKGDTDKPKLGMIRVQVLLRNWKAAQLTEPWKRTLKKTFELILRVWNPKLAAYIPKWDDLFVDSWAGASPFFRRRALSGQNLGEELAGTISMLGEESSTMAWPTQLLKTSARWWKDVEEAAVSVRRLLYDRAADFFGDSFSDENFLPVLDRSPSTAPSSAGNKRRQQVDCLDDDIAFQEVMGAAMPSCSYAAELFGTKAICTANTGDLPRGRGVGCRGTCMDFGVCGGGQDPDGGTTPTTSTTPLGYTQTNLPSGDFVYVYIQTRTETARNQILARLADLPEKKTQMHATMYHFAQQSMVPDFPPHFWMEVGEVNEQFAAKDDEDADDDAGKVPLYVWALSAVFLLSFGLVFFWWVARKVEYARATGEPDYQLEKVFTQHRGS